jgi:hypothetical protein
MDIGACVGLNAHINVRELVPPELQRERHELVLQDREFRENECPATVSAVEKTEIGGQHATNPNLSSRIADMKDPTGEPGNEGEPVRTMTWCAES